MPTLALDPTTGRPRIAYYAVTSQDLKYAAWNGATWVFEVPPEVDSIGDVGRYASLKLDPVSRLPRIAYYNGSALDLKYAEKAPVRAGQSNRPRSRSSSCWKAPRPDSVA